ncbi:MAG: tRNA (adenosine(37)-N6)-threonylcarbamoyltransferase complex ATPase subunit type 1 TsaE [Termitinemataceae bacterium]|nr:MAG: tRNA (adenosine(37)-N6)-threonylcarbamoyltransferase complex ATPase subunit type 1 TsaE [Termitinemataceae bacterium]
MQILFCKSAEETEAAGSRLAALLKSGDIVCLNGCLGAGKTCITRGIARGLGVSDLVTSPTYTIINEYETAAFNGGSPIPFYHIDAYRLSGAAAFEEIGGIDFLSGIGICVIEWAQRIEDILTAYPIADNITNITITIESNDIRKITVM